MSYPIYNFKYYHFKSNYVEQTEVFLAYIKDRINQDEVDLNKSIKEYKEKIKQLNK